MLTIIYPTASQLAVCGACVGTWKDWGKRVVSTRSGCVGTFLHGWHWLSFLYAQPCEPQLGDSSKVELDLSIDFPTDSSWTPVSKEIKTVEEDIFSWEVAVCPWNTILLFINYNPLEIFFFSKVGEEESKFLQPCSGPLLWTKCLQETLPYNNQKFVKTSIR